MFDAQPMTTSRTATVAIPAPILTQLDSRDVALWLSGDGASDPENAVVVARLPWSVVLSDRSDEGFLSGLEGPEPIDDPLVRRRGLLHIVDTDPADVLLPPRHLAVLLLNGRSGQRKTGLAAITRRLTMLQELRKRSVRQLVVVSSGVFAIPAGLTDLWEDGFRTVVTFVTDDPVAGEVVNQWRAEHTASSVAVVEASLQQFAEAIQREYLLGRDGSLVVRMRNEKGGLRNVDVGRIDDPQRPVLSSFDLIGTDALTPILPEDLTAGEVEGFFADPAGSWRPYAAGLPWQRDPRTWETLRNRLRTLDRTGVEANRILYVSTEPGAGATTFVRDLGWRAAAAGYPTLVARRSPSSPSGLEVSGLLTRLIGADRPQHEVGRLYEVPCVLIFDQSDWAGRHNELLNFAREIARSGRRVCIVLPMGPQVGIDVLSDSRFVELAILSHRVEAPDALRLGAHLNRFLAPHNSARTSQEWQAFFNASAVQDTRGVAAFWIVLSFWLQRQIDLNETVESRVYRAFRDQTADAELKSALLRIAAFSTVREPLPDELLPDTDGWPIADRIEDSRKELGVLGLIRVRGETSRYWAMAHNLLGRFVINGLFNDYATREALGFASATTSEHLRFMLLREISAQPVLQQAHLREVADAFAISIFKIDPGHGHGSFMIFWREVLDALDQMPRSLRATSRTFLHHCAISRRRIAADGEGFMLSSAERVELLNRATDDLRTALRLDASTGGESDINLFNSLAHALHDLAEAQADAGCDEELIRSTRMAAQEATREAYSLNPDNSFVAETYGRALLAQGAANEELAAERALEVLALVYGLMDRPGSEPRRNALGRLAERAFSLLLKSGGPEKADLGTELGAIAVALARLGAGVGRLQGSSLADLPAANRASAAMVLAEPILNGNVQAVKLRYLLICIDRPLDFLLQLNLLQSLSASGPAFTPQMQLEMALLMFQLDRANEGDNQFRQLRSLWRRGEHFVEVPQRLHWLLDASGAERRQVRARVATNAEGRAFAKVSELRGVEAPFRPAEFGQVRLAPGSELAGYISFGHNGPLLRPLTAARR
ncbi:hypothetical protein [Sphingomonas sp.]|uniref:hypothetical protein n=1 Tax=Sphingomonas sp. TaxID=28214 RepID=UPI002ED80A42